MRVRVQKWGNSLALRIPKRFAEDVGVGEGSVVEVSVSKGRLVVAPVTPGRARLDDLLRRVTKRNLHGETDTGSRVGREAWQCRGASKVGLGFVSLQQNGSSAEDSACRCDARCVYNVAA